MCVTINPQRHITGSELASALEHSGRGRTCCSARPLSGSGREHGRSIPFPDIGGKNISPDHPQRLPRMEFTATLRRLDPWWLA